MTEADHLIYGPKESENHKNSNDMSSSFDVKTKAKSNSSHENEIN